MEYRLVSDIHTHTIYSHGKGRIESNVDAGAAKGLDTVGIADHGPGHFLFGVDLMKVPQMRSDIERARQAHPGLEVLLGVEANIIDADGSLDVKKEDQKLFDYILAGYHYGVFGKSPVRAVRILLGGYVHGILGCSTSSAVNRNTDTVIAALHENDIRILTHPGDKAAFDIPAIAQACAETGTLMEINAHHRCLTVDGIRQAMKYDVRFWLSSDAHLPVNVGNIDAALRRAVSAGLDLSRIANLERI